MTETPDTDETLASLASRGDRAAFETIVRRHKASVYAFVRRYVGQADDANDVLQEAFLAAWLALSRYDAARPFLPWLRTIALNKCRDCVRRQRVRRLLLLAKAAEPIEIATADMQPDGLAEAERLDRLDAAIAALPVFYKEPFLLTTVSGLSHIEVAELLNTTAKAIEMRIRRARAKLALNLHQPAGEG